MRYCWEIWLHIKTNIFASKPSENPLRNNKSESAWSKTQEADHSHDYQCVPLPESSARCYFTPIRQWRNVRQVSHYCLLSSYWQYIVCARIQHAWTRHATRLNAACNTPEITMQRASYLRYMQRAWATHASSMLPWSTIHGSLQQCTMLYIRENVRYRIIYILLNVKIYRNITHFNYLKIVQLL